MNFDLTEEQKILQSSARDFLSRECPTEKGRALRETDEGYCPGIWKKMAELGWLGVVIPEEYGGIGGSLMELVILLEQMGYYLLPGPFFSTVVLAGQLILLAGNQTQREELLPQIASGQGLFTLALTEPHSECDHILHEIGSVRKDGGIILNVTKLFVLNAHISGRIICVVRTEKGADPEEGITALIVPSDTSGIRISPLETLGQEKQFEVVFEEVPVPEGMVLGEQHQAGAAVIETVKRASVVRAAKMLGGAQAAMDMALEYAKERVQFGRPIGSFQTVQRYFVDMWMDIQTARYLIYKAAWMISKGKPARKEAAMAKAHAGKACRRVTTLCHQVFGAIGFTMEHDMHLYYRQAMAGDLAFGNVDHQRRRVAEELGL